MTIRFEEMFRGWLPAMAADSRSTFGLDPAEMTPVELRQHVAMLGLGLSVEAAELVEEFQWKPWKTIHLDSFPVRHDRAKIAGEAADVLHFLAHLLNAAGVTEDELNSAMYEARKKNEDRQRDGYGY